MYISDEMKEIYQLLMNLRKADNALVSVSFQRDTINELLEEGVIINKEDFDLDQVSIKYSDGVNDIIKRANGELENQHMAQSFVILYIPYNKVNEVFEMIDVNPLDDDEEETEIKQVFPSKYVYAYIDLVDMSIRYNDECIAFDNERSM